MTSAGLPRFAVLQSNSNLQYLRHTNEYVDGSIRVTGDNVLSPYCKFELEMAKTGNGLVNIRSCYNSKYWVRESTNFYIKAGAAEPEEDQSKWSCTLFEPVHDEVDPKTIKLRLVYSQQFIALSDEAAPRQLSLVAGDATGVETKFTVIDHESLLILPKYVAFKGDNEKYLRTCTIDGNPYLKFDSTDAGDPEVAHEIINLPDGSVQIKSVSLKRCWRASPNWILADYNPLGFRDLNIDDTFFKPIKVGNNTVALRNIGNNLFCKRLTAEEDDCLSAYTPSITHFAVLTVEELVFSRTIFNVNFRLMDSRIYDQTVITMVTRSATNANTEPETIELRLLYTQSSSSTWDRSVSLNLGVSTTFKTGVPFIAEGAITVSAEFEGSYSWGDAQETSSEIETTDIVIVPPMTSVKVSVVATKGKCDIPFSYSQRDLLMNGEEVIYEMDDGIYTGISTYDFKFETTHEKL